MALHRQISQRDLSLRSQEILDAVEQGQTFTVTRDGREIAELSPIQRRKFVPAEDFISASTAAPVIDFDRFRADIDAAIDPLASNRYDR